MTPWSQGNSFTAASGLTQQQQQQQHKNEKSQNKAF
jgi:hypothetical protein